MICEYLQANPPPRAKLCANFLDSRLSLCFPTKGMEAIMNDEPKRQPESSPNSIEGRIFSQVKARTPGAENFNIVSLQQKFLKGSLYTVSFTIKGSEGQDLVYNNRAYVHGNAIEV